MPLIRNTGSVLTHEEWVEIMDAGHELAIALREAAQWASGHAWLATAAWEDVPAPESLDAHLGQVIPFPRR
jgi:hypothetical protein